MGRIVALALATTLLTAAGALARPADPRCFGAADRDPRLACDNPKLRLKVTPTPDQARVTPNPACTREKLSDVMDQCAFGTPAGKAVQTVAIIGDSHASHWRAAMAVVAKAKRWRVLEIATPHCPFSTATPYSGGEVVAWCPEWNRQVLDWFREHPELKTVFLAHNARAPIATAEGRTNYETRRDGYVEAWRALPSSVERMIVIRDTPTDRVRTHDCVRRAMSKRRSPRTCAVSRKRALPPDAALDAAKRLTGRRVGVIALTAHFCGARACLPVVGGVLVHKDVDHLTQVFARTLGPYLLRGVAELLAAPAQ